MHYKIPDYIKKTGIAELPVSYEWEDVEDYYYEVPRLFNKIDVLQSRSILAITIGFAEWVFWRLSKKYDGQPELILQLLEGVWACVVDRRYFNYISPPFEEVTLEHYKMPEKSPSFTKLYKGDIEDDLDKPIEGPILGTIMQVGVAATNTVPMHSDTTETVYASNMAEAVMGEKLNEFKKWRRDTITKLDKFYPFSETDYLGVPVPREVLDPGFDYNPDMAPELINNFLSNLDYKTNPFLTPPDVLISLGFEGTPYKYEL